MGRSFQGCLRMPPELKDRWRQNRSVALRSVKCVTVVINRGSIGWCHNRSVAPRSVKCVIVDKNQGLELQILSAHAKKMRESRFPPFGFVSSEFGLCALVLLLFLTFSYSGPAGGPIPIPIPIPARQVTERFKGCR